MNDLPREYFDIGLSAMYSIGGKSTPKTMMMHQVNGSNGLKSMPFNFWNLGKKLHWKEREKDKIITYINVRQYSGKLKEIYILI